MKVDVNAKISSEQDRQALCKKIESLTLQGWANFDGKVYATYIGDDEAIAQSLIAMFDALPDHEISFNRGYSK